MWPTYKRITLLTINVLCLTPLMTTELKLL